VEIALAIVEIDGTFVFDELYDRVEAISEASGMDEVPSESKVRVELDRLRNIGALERMAKVKGESVKREVPRESALWALCRELSERAGR
jgi:hypothetical protein